MPFHSRHYSIVFYSILFYFQNNILGSVREKFIDSEKKCSYKLLIDFISPLQKCKLNGLGYLHYPKGSVKGLLEGFPQSCPRQF